MTSPEMTSPESAPSETLPIYRSLDPSTGELLERFESASDRRVDSAIEQAAHAFSDWRRRPLMERTAVLEAVAGLLEERSDALALVMATEMGKPVAQGRAEARKCALVCRYYAQHAEVFSHPREIPLESPADAGARASVRFDPLGPIFAIMPWNFPFWQVFRFAAPALAAGNVALLQHAPCTPRCAATIEELLLEAGAPEGVFTNLYLSRMQAARVIADPAIRGVTLTGSTNAGRVVGGLAGGAIKPMVLELGGSDAFVIFEDADLEQAVAQGVLSRCLNSGQSCIAAKRFLVQESVYDRVLEDLVAAMGRQVVGPATAEESQIGPLAREDLRNTLASQVERARKEGASVLCGGATPDGPGFFYAPTVLADLPVDASTAGEELFGPVAMVFPFADEGELPGLVNRTDYGLGTSLWTGDEERAERLIPELDTGSVFVNRFVASDPRLPFGGTKSSGFGRELALDGWREFVNPKTTWIQPAVDR